MHLRAATLAMVVCGLMIGTLAAQYAQQGDDHAQSSSASSDNTGEPRRRFSLWDALTGRRSAPPPQNTSRQPQGPPEVYTRPRNVQETGEQDPSRQQASPQEQQTPVSQFGPPQQRGVRRPLGESNGQSNDGTSAETNGASSNAAATPSTDMQVPPSIPLPDSNPVQPGGQDSRYDREYSAQHPTNAQERPGFMYPLLDFLGNRHRPPQNVQQQPQQPIPQQNAPRANSAFAGNQQRPQQQESRGFSSLIPEAIRNGRPGPLPMTPQGSSGEPHLADSPAPAAPVRQVPPQNTGRPYVSQAPQQRSPYVPPQRGSTQQQTLPKMASSEISSPRLGPSDAEMGIEPPPKSDTSAVSEDSAAGQDGTSASILNNQPLVRVKKPLQPETQPNAAVKSLAESYRQRGSDTTTEQLSTFDQWLTRGKTFALAERFTEAVQAYSRAIEIDPYGLQAYGNRGLAYRELKMYREAVFDFNIVLRMKPEMAKGYYDRAETYRLAGKLEKAARDYEEAIRLSPDFALAHAQYGAMLMKNGEYEDAIEILDAAIALDDSDELSIYDRGLAKAMKGDFESAFADFDSLADPKLDGSTWETLLTRLRRPGEPITTVEVAPTYSSIAKSTPSDAVGDLSEDPFFSGSGTGTAAARSQPQRSQEPPRVAANTRREPKLFGQSEQDTVRDDVVQDAIVRSQPKPVEHTPVPTQQAKPEPTEIVTTPPQVQSNEPEEKPIRIVLGGGSTRLQRDRTSFVRVKSSDESSFDRNRANDMTAQAETNTPNGDEPAPRRQEIVSRPNTTQPQRSNDVSLPIAETQEGTDDGVSERETLWAAAQHNRDVTRAARRGDGSLFRIITSSDTAEEQNDPFAVTVSPRAQSGVGHVIRPKTNNKPKKEAVAETSKPAPRQTREINQLEFDGVMLPNPESVSTMAEIDTAIGEYNDAILRRPRFAPYYAARAKLWLKQERRTAALTDLRQAVRLDESLTEAREEKDALEKEIYADRARQLELLRTANRPASRGSSQ